MKEEISIVKIAIIAAAYAAITIAIAPIAYLIQQIRISDAMLIIPFHKKYGKNAVLGLMVGGFFANLASPIQPWDLIFGPIANLLACLVVYYLGVVSRKYELSLTKKLIIAIIGAFLAALIIAIIIGYELIFLAPPELSMGIPYIEAIILLLISESIAIVIGGTVLLSLLLRNIPEE